MQKDNKLKHQVFVGDVAIGGHAPIAIQSMTNTNTANIIETVAQIIELYEAGSEIVRVTVDTEDAIKAIPYIRENLLRKNCNVPLVGCFHYNGHVLLENHPAAAMALDKYRINPGNVGFGNKRDKHFEMIIHTALKHNKPIRIGVNWGSLDQSILQDLMDKNGISSNPKNSEEILKNALVDSALSSAELARNIGISADKIILSCKVSRVPDLIQVYQALDAQSNYPLHLGLTEAGMGMKGVVSSSSALAILLNQNIGNTIRVSITPKIGESRIQEVLICQEILQALELRNFAPKITACPGCGRTSSNYFQKLAEEIQTYIDISMLKWKNDSSLENIEDIKIAVMGCIVNGPGESKHANIGISLPGNNENPVAPVFVDGLKMYTLRGDNISKDFQDIIDNYIYTKCKKPPCY